MKRNSALPPAMGDEALAFAGATVPREEGIMFSLSRLWIQHGQPLLRSRLT